MTLTKRITTAPFFLVRTYLSLSYLNIQIIPIPLSKLITATPLILVSTYLNLTHLMSIQVISVPFTKWITTTPVKLKPQNVVPLDT
ncbi:hypothetical protein DAPPUDRAFT_299994 [Daphnia pulex]|uniref:Uncharacterized protein n=1 Tax=Daphnia pulex TaxID=6669 RepID=E9FRP4_DAPPU|nr:hypothetical protein DAPPUDRAFT_299994 [Daphnia pulex]|eukprot:EFX90452.1 hypothetical protein DAPPUDRAFT_299994 [Daphnia pulex]